MPVDIQPSSPSGNFELADEGIYEAVIVDIEDAGESRFTKGVRQIKVHFENEKGQKLMYWMNYKWWKGKPQASTLYQIAEAAGLVKELGDEVPTPDQINSLIGRTVLLTVKHGMSKQGREVSKITDFNPVNMGKK